MINRRTLLSGGAILGAGLVLPPFARINGQDRAPLPPSPQGARQVNVAQLATERGLCFGSCVSIKPLRADPVYRDLLVRNSNTLVHASAFQWHELQHVKGEPYRFADADAITAWIAQQNRRLRGHMMLDWAGLPGFLEPMIDTLSPAQTEKLLRGHVQRIGSRYRGKVIQWNVANEPMRGSNVRAYGWFKKLGENYIDIAFDETAKADPGVPLALNQNLIEMDQWYQRASLDATLELVRRLKDRGVPVASMGIEAHLLSQYQVNQKGLADFIRELARMDVMFMLTEFDVDDRAFSGSPDQRAASAASLTRDFLDVTLSSPTCEGLIFWGYVERLNWLNRDKKRARSDGQPQRSTPFDSQGNALPMWNVVADAVRKAPGPGARSLLENRGRKA